MEPYTIRRSKVALFIGYFLAEGTLSLLLAGMLIIWREDPAYLDWPLAIISWVVVAVFFHFLLFIGTFYKVEINGDIIIYYAFLRKPKTLCFSDIQNYKSSTGVDVKIMGHNNKKLFYVKRTDRNFDQFMTDIVAHRNWVV